MSKKDEILKTACDLVEVRGPAALTRKALSKKLGVPPTTINYYFGGLRGLQSAMMAYAIAEKRLRVLGLGLLLYGVKAYRRLTELGR